MLTDEEIAEQKNKEKRYEKFRDAIRIITFIISVTALVISWNK